MPRATCRCGQVLSFPVNGPDRVICPKCSSRIRVRRDPPKVGAGDGFVRFSCSCGRRLKVRAESTSAGSAQQSGKCPDCGRIVPVPAVTSSSSAMLKVKSLDPETPTEEMSAQDLLTLDRWTARHASPRRSPASPANGENQAEAVATPPALPAPANVPAAALEAPAAVKAEAGLRVCPRCGRPLHLSAVTCRDCGAPVPKR
jgi:DNA-directed RNA polymerase subunit RPC12/RpoP